MVGPAASPLTAFCTKLADRDTLVGMVDQMTVENRGNIDNRAIALSLTWARRVPSPTACIRTSKPSRWPDRFPDDEPER
jgi:hypothetical protein